MHPYFRPVELKKSLAEPVDFFHYNGTLGWHAEGEMTPSLPLNCGPALGRSEAGPPLPAGPSARAMRAAHRVHEDREL